METTTSASIVAAARARTDSETPSPDTDHIKDSYLYDVLTRGYKRLIDMILASSGTAGLTLLAVSADLADGTLTVPADVYRVVDVRRLADNDTWAPLPTANWRNRQQRGSTDWPVYTIVGSAIVLDPPTATPGTLKIWYVPNQTALDSMSSLNTFNGWDEWLIGYVSNEIAVRSGDPTADHQKLMEDSEKRIKIACIGLRLGHTQTLAQVAAYAEDYFGWY